MEANKILSADILDIIFDGKNKDYGAYELRKTYNRRITRALVITGSVALLALLASVLSSTLSDKGDSKVKMNEMTIQDIKQEEKKEPPPPPPPTRPAPGLRAFQQEQEAQTLPPRLCAVQDSPVRWHFVKALLGLFMPNFKRGNSSEVPAAFIGWVILRKS